MEHFIVLVKLVIDFLLEADAIDQGFVFFLQFFNFVLELLLLTAIFVSEILNDMV